MEGTQTSESDVVTAQQPPAGARVQPGTAVRVRTQPMTTVPDLTKRDVGSALVLLQRSRLRLGNAGENSSEIIIGQAPRAGTRVPWGTTVIVKVAPPVVGKPPGTTDSDLVQVPKLVGGTVGQARTKVSQSRLRMARVNANESATVVAQDPAAGSRVPAGSLVSVLSEEGVLVPNLVNQSVANAKMMLHQARLRLGNTPERDSDIVIGQEPPPGGRVRAGSPVSVQTQQRVRVPNVVNRSVAEGRNILGASGLRLENRGASDDVITAQDPPPGALVAVDSTVRVKTLDRVAIPDVVNRSVSDAKTILSQAGLRLSSDAGSESDRVVAQNPQAGTKVPTGSPVTVRTQHLVPVPNLVNRSVADARAALAVAELKLEGPSGKDSDTVGSQSPPAGTLVPAGSVVALKLANPPPPWKEVVGVLAGILAILGSGYFFRLKASGPQARKEALRRARIQVVAQIDLGGQQAETSPFAEAAPPLRIRLIGSEGEQTIGPPVKEAKAAHG